MPQNPFQSSLRYQIFQYNTLFRQQNSNLNICFESVEYGNYLDP